MVDATTLLGRYKLEQRIAAGGMGAVYRATDERLGRPVAIKLLKDDLAEDGRFVERFRREARAVAALAHPNIANVFDYAEDGGRHFIVMELAEGRDLARLLRAEGPIPEERAATLAAQVCDALGHAHGAGVIHRDIKPANIIVGDQDRVKVTDFGIARAAGETTLTAAGSVLGSAQYMSPEQASGDEVGPRSDLFSLGIVLFEMLTGAAPFEGDSPISIAMRHVAEDVPRPSTLDPKVSSQLDEVVGRATARRPEQRYAEASGMREALIGASGGSGAPDGGGAAATTAIPAVAPTTPLTNAGGAGGTEVWPPPRTPAGRRARPAVAVPPPRRGAGGRLLIALALLALAAVPLFLLLAGDDEPASGTRDRGGGVQQNDDQSPDPDQTQEETVTVPDDLIGLSAEEAQAELRALGLVGVVATATGSSGEPGTVAATEPGAGAEVAPGGEVTLFIVPESAPEESPSEDDPGPPEDAGNDKAPKGKAKGHDKGGD